MVKLKYLKKIKTEGWKQFTVIITGGEYTSFLKTILIS